MAACMDGCEVPAGKVAFVVTHLEMRARPAPRPTMARPGCDLRRVIAPDLGWYRDLFRRIGADWLWFGRLRMADAMLADTLASADVHVYALFDGAQAEGLVELDFRRPGACELSYFGVTSKMIGSGAGRAMMSFAIAQAWERPISRFWVHTCTGDHPGALDFYVRSGFTPYLRTIEIADDPRLLGLLPEHVGRHVPLIR